MEPFGIVPKGDKLILTAGDANGHAMLSVSSDLMVKYALKVGADFKIINQQNHSEKPLPRPHAVKFYITSQLQDYANVVWIDADCLISPNAPDIFETVPATYEFAAWCGEGLAFADDKLVRPTYRHGYFNSGVMLARCGRPFERALEFMTTRREELTQTELHAIMGEQTPLNKAVDELGLSVYQLPAQWNFLLSADKAKRLDVNPDPEMAYIVHCAGGMFTDARQAKNRAERAEGMQRLRQRFGW
jgi:lipopolysaccharide biosynthesis glycosyltransferase